MISSATGESVIDHQLDVALPQTGSYAEFHLNHRRDPSNHGWRLEVSTVLLRLRSEVLNLYHPPRQDARTHLREFEQHRDGCEWIAHELWPTYPHHLSEARRRFEEEYTWVLDELKLSGDRYSRRFLHLLRNAKASRVSTLSLVSDGVLC